MYFPRGTFLEIAMKYSTRKDLKELYAMAERLNPYVEYKGQSNLKGFIILVFEVKLFSKARLI